MTDGQFGTNQLISLNIHAIRFKLMERQRKTSQHCNNIDDTDQQEITVANSNER